MNGQATRQSAGRLPFFLGKIFTTSQPCQMFGLGPQGYILVVSDNRKAVDLPDDPLHRMQGICALPGATAFVLVSCHETGYSHRCLEGT
jgi:hypothetical protein